MKRHLHFFFVFFISPAHACSLFTTSSDYLWTIIFALLQMFHAMKTHLDSPVQYTLVTERGGSASVSVLSDLKCSCTWQFLCTHVNLCLSYARLSYYRVAIFKPSFHTYTHTLSIWVTLIHTNTHQDTCSWQVLLILQKSSASYINHTLNLCLIHTHTVHTQKEKTKNKTDCVCVRVLGGGGLVLG